MATQKLTLAQEHLDDTIRAFDAALSDLTPEELLGARAIAEILRDARRRMTVLRDRVADRLEGRRPPPD